MANIYLTILTLYIEW